MVVNFGEDEINSKHLVGEYRFAKNNIARSGDISKAMEWIIN